MKTKFCIIGFLIALIIPAWGGVYSYGTAGGGSAIGVIPDNSSIGLADSHAIGGLDNSISSLILSITLQGGVATDLSGYLRLGNLTTSPAFSLTSIVQSQNLSSGSPVTFTVDASTLGTTFNTLNPNDTWTLFFADTVNGDQTTLNGWSLDITAVPEPANIALGVFVGILAAAALARCFARPGHVKTAV